MEPHFRGRGAAVPVFAAEDDLSDPIPVSVLVPTRNEELNLEACLSCLSGFGEVIVFDSLSTDSTVEIARKHRRLCRSAGIR